MNQVSFDELKVGEWYWIRHEGPGQIIGCYEFKSKSYDKMEFYFYDRATSTGYPGEYKIQYLDAFEFFGPIQLPQILIDDKN